MTFDKESQDFDRYANMQWYFGDLPLHKDRQGNYGKHSRKTLQKWWWNQNQKDKVMTDEEQELHKTLRLYLRKVAERSRCPYVGKHYRHDGGDSRQNG